MWNVKDIQPWTSEASFNGATYAAPAPQCLTSGDSWGEASERVRPAGTCACRRAYATTGLFLLTACSFLQLLETRLLLQYWAETVGVTVPSTVHCNSKKDETEHVIRLSWLKQTRTAHRLSPSELCVSILLLGCEDAALWTTSDE